MRCGSYTAIMQKLLGGIAVLISLGCFALVTPWAIYLVGLGWPRALRRLGNIPLDTAIGCGLIAFGAALLVAGISLLLPPRKPPS